MYSCPRMADWGPGALVAESAGYDWKEVKGVYRIWEARDLSRRLQIADNMAGRSTGSKSPCN